MRIFLCLLIYFICLGFVGIHVEFKDGLRVDLNNWWERKNNG